MPTLTVRDETATGDTTHELTLDLLDETLTVRELIRSRVYQEVDDHNRNKRTDAHGKFNGLVTPTPHEKTLNGAKPSREIDWKKQFDAACEAFDRNGFFILIDDRQAESLDEQLTLRHDTTVSFVRLTPLMGG
ncbi:MAG: hypothetical protein AAGD32_07990 [Planctomycetota bacterium]